MIVRQQLWACASLALAVAVVACGSSDDEGSSADAPAAPSSDLVAHVASFDIVAGREQRFIVGLLTSDQEFVGYGSDNVATEAELRGAIAEVTT